MELAYLKINKTARELMAGIGIRTVRDAAMYSDETLLRIRRLGKVGLANIKDGAKKCGVNWNREKKTQLPWKNMTPKTDREIWWVGFKPDERLEVVWADFARDLERENERLRTAIEFLQLEIEEMKEAQP
jgi:hypothetical protein